MDKQTCNTCWASLPATPRHFHVNQRVKPFGLDKECKSCKAGKLRDYQLSKEDRIAERLKLAARLRWFEAEMPKYLSRTEQTDLKVKAFEDLEYELPWSEPSPMGPEPGDDQCSAYDEWIATNPLDDMVTPREDGPPT